MLLTILIKMNNNEINYTIIKSNNKSVKIIIEPCKPQKNTFNNKKKCKKGNKIRNFKDSVKNKTLYFAQSKIFNSPKASELPIPVFD
jgi:hypothetical protein